MALKDKRVKQERQEVQDLLDQQVLKVLKDRKEKLALVEAAAVIPLQLEQIPTLNSQQRGLVYKIQ